MPGRAPKKLKVFKKSKNSHPVFEKLEKGPQNIQLIKNRKYLKYSKKTEESQSCMFTHSLSYQFRTGTEELQFILLVQYLPNSRYHSGKTQFKKILKKENQLNV